MIPLDTLKRADMTYEQIHTRVERTLRRNRAAIKRANESAQGLSRLAEQSQPSVDRAFRQLRQAIK